MSNIEDPKKQINGITTPIIGLNEAEAITVKDKIEKIALKIYQI